MLYGIDSGIVLLLAVYVGISALFILGVVSKVKRHIRKKKKPKLYIIDGGKK